MESQIATEPTTKLEPLIIAAIAGGVFAFLVVFLCFLFWCYFKRRNKDASDDGNDSDGLTMLRMGDFDPNAPRAQVGKKRHFGSRGSSSKSTKVETSFVPVIPKIVDLGEDGQSLADTTIGDQTAGRRPPKKKRFIDLEAAYASFDEESLYTSTHEKASGRNLYGIQPSSEIFEDYMNNGTNLGVKIDYDDEFLHSGTGMAVASNKMGLLGPIPPSFSMASQIRGLVDDELNGNDSDSFQSVLYMSDAESPISVALSNCDRDKSGDVREFVDFNDDLNVNVFIPMDDHETQGMLEDAVTHSAAVKFLDEAANVYVEGHDGHKLLSASTSSESGDPADVAPVEYDICKESSKSQPIPPTDSDSQMTNQIDRLGSSSPVAIDSKSSPPEGRTPFLPIKRTVKRNVIRPWAPTPRHYRTRPLGGVGLSKSHNSAQLYSTKPSVLSPLRGEGSSEGPGVSVPFSIKEDESVYSGHSADTDKDDSWLFDTVDGALGPRSESADLESLSGSSQKSSRSITSQHARKRQISRIRPTASVGSSGLSHSSFGEEKSATEMPPQRLKHNLQQNEMQLSVLPNNESLSPLVATSVAKSANGHLPLAKRTGSNHRVVVVAPAGKLGIILANRKDGKGSVVSEVRPSSVLQGALVAGDKLVAIDGRDVTTMVVSQITSIMASKSNQERRLTIVRKNQQKSLAQEAKISSP